MKHKTWIVFAKNTESTEPWDNEPDKEQWPDPLTDLPCMYLRNRFGALCGYVGVDPAHPIYGADYCDAGERVEVHGGLTYADYGEVERGKRPEMAIAHVPEPGEPSAAEVYWFGFDCNHFNDYAPGLHERDRQLRVTYGETGTYRDVAYVKAECAALAFQLAQMSYPNAKAPNAPEARPEALP